MKKKRLAFHGSGFYWKYALTHPWEEIKHWIREIKWFIQRGLYGWADSDSWGLDWYLSTWLPSALRKYKTGSGFPGYGTANTYKKWGNILEKMAKGFEAHLKVDDIEFTNSKHFQKEIKKLQKIEKEGLQLFVEYFGYLWN